MKIRTILQTTITAVLFCIPIVLNAADTPAYYTCNKVDTPIVINGNIDSSWQKAEEIVLDQDKNYHLLTTLPRKGSTDMSVSARLAYDDDYLYFIANVRDDVFTQGGSSVDAWNGDSLQFGISSDGHANYWECILALCQGQPMFSCYQAGSGHQASDVTKSAHYMVKQGDKDHMIYEFALPWTSLSPITPQTDEFRFSFIFNDADNGPRKAWMEWVTPSGIGETKNPSQYGIVKLAKSVLSEDTGLKGLLIIDRKQYTDDDEVHATLSIGCGKSVDVSIIFTLRRNGQMVLTKEEYARIDPTMKDYPFIWKTEKARGGDYKLSVVVQDKSGVKLAEYNSMFEKLNADDIRKITSEFTTDADKLAGILSQCKAKNIQTPYQTAVLTIARQFPAYIEEDLDRRETNYNPVPDTTALEKSRPVVGDLKALYWNRASDNALYIKNQVRAAISEADELLANPGKAVSIPKLDLNTLSYSNGHFYDKNGPVILVGSMFGQKGQVKDEMSFISNLGFNWWGMLSGGIGNPYLALDNPPEKWTDIYMHYQSVTDAYRRAGELGIALDTGIGWYGMAEKGEKHDPGCPAGWIFDLKDPKGTDLVSRYLGRIGEITGKFKAQRSYMLYNEVSYRFCNCSVGRRDFQKAMLTKYGSIARLNNAWGTMYKSFSELTVPKDRSANKGQWYDYNNMHLNKLPERLKWTADQIKKTDKKSLIHTKTMNGMLDCWDYCFAGIDRERVGNVTDLYEFDGQMWYGTTKSYAIGPWQELPAYDLQRSLKPNAPTVETEFHIMADDTWSHVDNNYIEACYWLGATHGVGGFLQWVWWHEGYNAANHNAFPDHANRLHALSTTALDMRRLAKYITAIPTRKSQVAVLFSNASMIHQQNQWSNLVDIYKGLYWLNTPPTDFITEKQIASGKLKNYKLLVIHNTPYIPKNTLKSITNYVKNGGNLVITVGSALFDPYGKPLDISGLVGGKVGVVESGLAQFNIDVKQKSFLKGQNIAIKANREMAGITPATGISVADYNDIPIITINHYGKGKVIYIGALLSMESYTRLFDKIYNGLGVKQGTLRIKDKNRQVQVGIEVREAVVNGKRVVYLMNLNSNTMQIKLDPAYAGKYKEMVRGETVGDRVKLKPLVPWLLVAK